MKDVTFRNDNQLAEDIKVYIKQHRLTIRKFSELSGINVAIISRIIHGNYNPGSKMYNRILNTLNNGKSEVDYIMGAGPQVIKTVNIIDITDAERMSIDELTNLIDMLKSVRENKIQSKIIKIQNGIKTYNNKLEELNNLLKEDEESLE